MCEVRYDMHESMFLAKGSSGSAVALAPRHGACSGTSVAVVVAVTAASSSSSKYERASLARASELLRVLSKGGQLAVRTACVSGADLIRQHVMLLG